ncbi:histidine phosphatase family protein [Pseudoalteromonas sp. MER144-MNA-CIBAN-0113]|mgnify:CR=1 FL=1|uniref:histidine phosphatase family protein n=1 Tax=Pseudoalteromonas sp. MER144-MNA-CIBAN-0113 TaxID=3140429 RepID=UPI00332B34D4
MTPFYSQVYLLRHGELEEQNVLAGHTDFLLSEEGIQQLKIACEGLANVDQVCSSPLKRCSQFADSFSDANHLPLYLMEGIKEFNFGDWDGRKYDELWQLASAPTIGDFWQNPWFVSPPNGEDMADFYSRVHHWWQQTLIDITEKKIQSQLVVTHAGVIKQLLAIICQMPKQINYQNIFTVDYGKLVCIDIFVDEQGITWPKITF